MDVVEVDAVGTAREMEEGESARSGGPVFGGHKVAGCGSVHKEYNSVSRNERADAELCKHDNPLPSFKCDEFGRRQYHGDLLPKNEGKQLIRKPTKNLSTISYSKRPRRDQPESSMETARVWELVGIARKIESDLIRCTSSEYNSVSRNERADAELCKHDNPVPSFKCDEFGKRQYHEDLLPKNEGKQLIRKPIKNLSTISCSKRPRRDQPESSMETTRVWELVGIARKIESDLIRCTSSESRMIRKKCGQDGKRTDKKLSRAGGKTKHDSLTLKPVFSTSNTTGGNDILGIYGLKSDLHDVTKHMNELSLEELLDGSYKYSYLCLDKGKKFPHVSENIISSVRKACAVLSSHCSKDSSCSRNSLSCLQSANPCLQKLSNCVNMDKCIEESETFIKDQESYLADMSNLTLYQPKDILERLALPRVHDLDGLLLELNMPSLSLQSKRHTTRSPANLPPFPWSFSYNGAYRHSVDPARLASARNLCQGRWARIGNSCISTEDGKSCLSELDMKTCYYNEDPSDQQMADDLPQDVKSLKSYIKHSCDELASASHIVSSLSEAHLPDKIISAKGADVLVPCSPLHLNFLGEHTKIPDGHQNFDTEDYASHANLKADGGLNCQGGESKLLKLHEDNNFPQNRRHTRDLSPRVLAAAEILCEMSSCCGDTRKRDHNIGRMKWQPNEPSKKVMKACRPMSPVNKADKLSHASRYHDPVRGTGLPTTRLKSTSEKEWNHVNSVGRRPVKLSVCEEGPSSRKQERELACSLKSLDGVSFRSIASMPSPIRADKGLDNLPRLRSTSTSTSVSSGGVHIKDWSRGRIKRL